MWARKSSSIFWLDLLSHTVSSISHPRQTQITWIFFELESPHRDLQDDIGIKHISKRSEMQWFQTTSQHCFVNISSRKTLITSIFVDLRSTHPYLQDDIGIKWVGERLCTFNLSCVHYFAFWHASRKMGSTSPNRPQFLLHEGKV
jgi:hypothetical protein